MTWSPQALDTLRTLVDEGLSTGEIAARMGLSRSAVAGRIHRAKGALGTLRRKPGYQRPKTEAADKSARPPRKTIVPPPLKPELLFVSPPCRDFTQPPLRRRARDIVVVPMPFSRAMREARCLFYACDDYAPASSEMLVCGCKRASYRGSKPYCSAHLVAETAERVAA